MSERSRSVVPLTSKSRSKSVGELTIEIDENENEKVVGELFG